MKKKLATFKDFIGFEVWKYLSLSLGVGFVWFAVESSFLFMIQGFLFTIGLLKKEQVMLPSWYPTSFMASIIIMISFGFFRSFIQMVKLHLATLTQQTFTCNQRVNVLTLGLKNASLVSTKEIVSIYGDIIYQSGNSIYNFSQLIITTSAVFFFFIAGLTIAPYEMIIGISLLAILLFPIKKLIRNISVLGTGLLIEGESLNNSLLGGLKNNFFLTIYKQIDAEIEVGSNSLKKYRDHFSDYSKIANFSVAFPAFCGVLILAFITLLSVKYIHTNPYKLISFFYIFLRLAQAAGEAGSTMSNIKLSFPGMQKLYQWTVNFRNIAPKSNLETVVISGDAITIEVENLSFSYNESSPLFENLNFSLKKSDALIIKGESGTGKSTLLSILLGINFPTVGSVKINNISSNDFQFDLHKTLAYVGPEPYFMAGTIKENFYYGLESNIKISDEEIWNALELMELKEFVNALPLKLNETVLDIPQFSTGQKQRLSFARALVRKAQILILDEATANLDADTERRIIERLEPVFKNCLSIIVTHKSAFDQMGTKQIYLKKK